MRETEKLFIKNTGGKKMGLDILIMFGTWVCILAVLFTVFLGQLLASGD